MTPAEALKLADECERELEGSGELVQQPHGVIDALRSLVAQLKQAERENCDCLEAIERLGERAEQVERERDQYKESLTEIWSWLPPAQQKLVGDALASGGQT